LPLISTLSHAAPVAGDDDRVAVLISVDGLAHFYLDDPKADMPTIRQLAKEGTRADGMVGSLPTVTWPNHTTLVTGVHPGRHGVIGNNYFDRAEKKIVPLIPDPIFNKDEIVKAPTVYDAAKAAGLRTAAIIWPASRGAKTLDWTVPDVFLDEVFQKYSTPSLLKEFKEAGIPYEKQQEWCKTGKGEDRDRMYVRMLNHVLRTHKPNLALLHLVEVDHVEHAKGPQTPEAYAAVKFADDRVREVWDELKTTFPGRATLVVVSDHGFYPYRQQIQPNVQFRRAGLLEVKGTQITGGRVRAVSQGGASFIYVLDAGDRSTVVQQIARQFQTMEGIQQVLTPADYAKYGLADPAKDARMPDLVLCAKSGYSFNDVAAGDVVVTPKTEAQKGTHGYAPDQAGMHATFVAWGAGVPIGGKLGLIDSRDVAPTLAALLGIKMKDVEGKMVLGR
jgi:predicted AlkP superfamily pyrophosphatase or phosphodiesterase